MDYNFSSYYICYIHYQVISTSKYREALGLCSIPIIPLLGINPSHPVINDRTQFTLLHSWCGKFVITHHQHALWVLDPSSNSVVATLAGRLPIIDITCNKDSVYLLQPDKCPIVKLTIHADFKRLLAPGKGLSSSSSDLSSTLDSGSYRLSVESSSEHSTAVSTGSAPVVANTTPVSSKQLSLVSSQQNLSQNTSQSVPKSLSHDETHSVSQDTAQSVPKSLSRDATHSMSQDMSQSVPKSVSQDVVHNMSQDVTHGMSQNVSQSMSQSVSQDMSQDTSHATKSKNITGTTLAEMPIEDRLHKMHISFSTMESSKIAVQSVLKKKKKKKKKVASHDTIG